MPLVNMKALIAVASGDPEFVRETRYLNGAVKVGVADDTYVLHFENGKIARLSADDTPDAACKIVIKGARELWTNMLAQTPIAVCFSNRPFGVKRFQTIHHHSVDVARRLVLLFGISTTALPSWVSRTRWTNLKNGLAVRLTVGPSRLTDSSHPSSREGHLSTVRWSSSFLLSYLILDSPHATANSRAQRNSVPSTHMRCMITANRRASATIAFFIPRCLAIFIAQALSHDHFAERSSMTWAAS